MATLNNEAWVKGHQPLIMEFCTSPFGADILRFAIRFGPSSRDAIGYEAMIGNDYGTGTIHSRARQTIAALREAADKFEAILELEKD